MATGSSGVGFTRERRRSTETGQFTKQLIAVTLRGGRRVFSSRDRDFTTEQLKNAVWNALTQAFRIDFIEGFRLAADRAVAEIISRYIPMVALDKGRLRNAIIDLTYEARQAIDILIETGKGAETRLELEYDFQRTVWSVLNYAIYHAVEFRKLDFYENPTTGGTAPYSTILYFQLWEEVVNRETLNHLQRVGWDIKSSIRESTQLIADIVSGAL